jgi:hypothetical protein
MPDLKPTALPALTSLAAGDIVAVVDVSDTTDDAAGSDKQITGANLATSLASLGTFATDAEVTAAVAAHTGDSTAAHAASAISFTPAGTIAGTDVQTAVAEVATDAAAALTAHEAAGDPHPGYTTTAELATHAAVTSSVHGISAFGATLVDDADAAAARTTLELVIGTDVQAQDAELAAIAGLTSAADRLPYFTGSGTAAVATFTAAGRALVDDADADAQLATLAAVDRENGGLETVASPTISANALTLNLATGNVFTVAHNANITTLTLSGATSGRMCSLSLRLTQDATGGRTITWPASVDWPSATAPTLITTANAVNWVELWTVDGGTTWFGALSGAGFA